MGPAPGRTLRRSGWYALVHDHGQTWAAVERIAPLLRLAAQALAGHLDAHGAMA